MAALLGWPFGGDPADLATGLFVYNRTDLFLPDVIPIALTRTYRPADAVSRAFGIGTTTRTPTTRPASCGRSPIPRAA